MLLVPEEPDAFRVSNPATVVSPAVVKFWAPLIVTAVVPAPEISIVAEFAVVLLDIASVSMVFVVAL
jgi:collagenase-like PrtC family protease